MMNTTDQASPQTDNTTLIYAGLSYPPFVYPCYTNYTVYTASECTNPGIDVEIMLYLLKMLNISSASYDGYLPEFWGTKLPNGTYNGGLGMIERGQFDTYITWFRVTEQRAKDFDFTYPILYSLNQVGFITQRPKSSLVESSSSEITTSVMSLQIWITFLVFVVTICVLMTSVTNFVNWRNGCKIKGFESINFSGFWTTVTVMVNQFTGNVSTDSRAGNILTVFMGLFFFFFAATYKGLLVRNMNTNSTVTEYFPFHSTPELADLVERGEKRVIFDSDGSGNVFFKEMLGTSDIPAYKQLRNALAVNPSIDGGSLNETLTALELDSKLVFPGQDFLSSLTMTKGRCNLMFIPDKTATATLPAAFIFKKGSPYVKRFRVLLAGSGPMIHQKEEKYIRYETENNERGCPISKRYKGDPLTITNFSGVLKVALTLITAALVTFLGETVFRKIRSVSTKTDYDYSTNQDLAWKPYSHKTAWTSDEPSKKSKNKFNINKF